jgi:hypothetical protein
MEKFLTVLGVILLVIILGAIFGAWPVQLLWNWLMTDLFGLRRISFWEAWGLMILGALLFKSSGSYSKKD